MSTFWNNILCNIYPPVQVRLELEMFLLADPDISGNCRTDYMQVSRSSRHNPGLPTIKLSYILGHNT